MMITKSNEKDDETTEIKITVRLMIDWLKQTKISIKELALNDV